VQVDLVQEVLLQDGGLLQQVEQLLQQVQHLQQRQQVFILLLEEHQLLL
jgi:hypothetical protein